MGLTAMCFKHMGVPPNKHNSIKIMITLALWVTKPKKDQKTLVPCGPFFLRLWGHKTYLTIVLTRNPPGAEISKDNKAKRSTHCGISLSYAAKRDTLAKAKKESPNNKKDHQVKVATDFHPLSTIFQGFNLDFLDGTGLISTPFPKKILCRIMPKVKVAKMKRMTPIPKGEM
mmetsp:Transcript_27364/g.66455  ORF Transcript_27364/g.66455 Transcript_27364/m.66455 type:complete len:172 (+) Transcript_27364:773-1288(+)